MERRDLSNTDLVAFAVYLLGGERRLVHTEDVAVQAARLGPGRFNWKRHPDKIDISLIRRSLSSAKRSTNYLAGSARSGWKLTERGTDFVKAHEARIPASGTSLDWMSDEERRFHPWQRRRIQAHPAYRLAVVGRAEEVTAGEAEAFFLFDPAMDRSERARKVEFLVKSFAGDPVIGPAVALLATRLK